MLAERSISGAGLEFSADRHAASSARSVFVAELCMTLQGPSSYLQSSIHLLIRGREYITLAVQQFKIFSAVKGNLTIEIGYLKMQLCSCLTNFGFQPSGSVEGSV